MARIRSLHPGQWRDERFVELSFGARLLCLGLRNLADDQGVFEWKPKTIKMELFPAEDVPVAEFLSELERWQHVRKFREGGRDYGVIRNFCQWQRPKKPNAIYPLPEELKGYTTGELEPEEAEPVPNQFPTGTEKVSQRKEEGGRREEKTPPNPPSSEGGGVRSSLRRFDEFWQSYPRKEGTDAAKRAWTKRIRDTDPEEILGGLERAKAMWRRNGTERRFIPQPSKWLNDGRWQDDLGEGRLPAENPPEWSTL